jgi:hypothetical protein
MVDHHEANKIDEKKKQTKLKTEARKQTNNKSSRKTKQNKTNTLRNNQIRHTPLSRVIRVG